MEHWEGTSATKIPHHLRPRNATARNPQQSHPICNSSFPHPLRPVHQRVLSGLVQSFHGFIPQVPAVTSLAQDNGVFCLDYCNGLVLGSPHSLSRQSLKFTRLLLGMLLFPTLPQSNPTFPMTCSFLSFPSSQSTCTSCLVLVAKSCRTLQQGILQGRILEWVGIPFSRGSS